MDASNNGLERFKGIIARDFSAERKAYGDTHHLPPYLDTVEDYIIHRIKERPSNDPVPDWAYKKLIGQR